MKRKILSLVLLALQAFIAGHAAAEKGDSEKQIDVTSNSSQSDDVKGTRVFVGNVVLTQGTLIMKGTKLIVTESPDGWQFATMYATPGGLATMRQKRDGGPDLWMEGEAVDRITYDQKTSIATLYTKAKVRRLTGPKMTEEADGAYLSYNSQTEYVTGANSESGESTQGDGRVIVHLQPKPHPADAKAADTKAPDGKPTDSKSSDNKSTDSKGQ
jgi:lipopolysaccharide export system protein LptA